jgi:hypothetical protein
MRTAGRDRSREKKKEIKKKNEAIVFRDDAVGGALGEICYRLVWCPSNGWGEIRDALRR